MAVSYKSVLQKITDDYGNEYIKPLGTITKFQLDKHEEALKSDDKIISELLGNKPSDITADKLADAKKELSEAGRAYLDVFDMKTSEGIDNARKKWGEYREGQELALGSGLTGVAKLGGKIKGIAKNIGAMTLNMAAFAAAAFVISKVATAIDDAIHANERAIEAASKMKDTWSEMDSAQKNAEEAVAQNGERLVELSKGVGADGENLSLTADEYREYITLSNELAGIFPGMVQGFNAQGDAILNMTGGLEGLNEQLF